MVAPRRPLAVLLALLAACAHGCAGGRAQPDVVLITIDTLRADHLGAYGHAAARTPHIDALARRGVRFLHATTPAPRTTPALASLFTGLWPHHHGARAVGVPLRHGVTLAEILARRGWTTLGVSANKVASAKEHLDRGFARFVNRSELPHWRAASVTQQALALAAEAPPSAPVLLWVHYMDPHAPYNPPRDFEPGPSADPCRRLMDERHVHRAAVQRNVDGIAARAVDACRALYDGEIAYIDEQVGALLAGLRDQGRLANAFVVLTADHGENFGESGIYYQHGLSVHDASLRVPLVVVGPGIAPGVDGGVFRHEDLLPTLLGLLGVPAEERPPSDGADLSARLLRGGAAAPADLVAFGESADGERTARTPRFKLVERPRPGGGVERALYDLAADPGETRDVAAAHPEVARALGERLSAWTAGISEEIIEYDAETLERLRTLGYLE